MIEKIIPETGLNYDELFSDLWFHQEKHNFVDQLAFKSKWMNEVMDTTNGMFSMDELSFIFDANYNEELLVLGDSVRGKTYENVPSMEFLYTLFDKCQIMIENGVVFDNHRIKMPPSTIVYEDLIPRRKSVKKRAIKELTQGDPLLGASLNRVQNAIKVIMNSYYGVLTNQFSRFNNADLGGSITSSGRSTIALCALSTEAALGSRTCKEVGAVMNFIKMFKVPVTEEFESVLHYRDVTVTEVMRDKDWFDYYGTEAVFALLNTLSQKELNRIHYKNNLPAILEIPGIVDKFANTYSDILKLYEDNINKFIHFDSKHDCGTTQYHVEENMTLETLKEYVGFYVSLDRTEFTNTKLTEGNIEKYIGETLYIRIPEFCGCDGMVCTKCAGNVEKTKIRVISKVIYINPYEPPTELAEHIRFLKALAEQVLFGFNNYRAEYVPEIKQVVPDLQATIRNIHRKRIALMDTDSTMIIISNEISLLRKVVDRIGLDLDKIPEDFLWYTHSNIVATIAGAIIDKSLNLYKEYRHVLPEYTKLKHLKNEFLYKVFLLTTRRKNYLGLMNLKEGEAFAKPKRDVKGLGFIKSNFNQELCEFVESIVDKYILTETTNIKKIQDEIRNFKDTLIGDLRSNAGKRFYETKKLNETLEIVAAKERGTSDYRYKACMATAIMQLTPEIDLPGNFILVPIDLSDKELFHVKYPEKYAALVSYNGLNQILADEDTYITLQGYTEINRILGIGGDWEDMYVKYMTTISYHTINQLRYDGNDDEYLKYEDLMSCNTCTPELFREFAGKYFYKMEANMYAAIDDMYLEYAEKVMDAMSGERSEITLKEILLSMKETKSAVPSKKISKVLDVINGVTVKKTPKALATTLRVKPKLKSVEDVYKKVAIPVDFLDANPVPELLLDFINLKPIVSTLNNLLAPVMQALGLSVVRDDGSLNITNTVDYY